MSDYRCPLRRAKGQRCIEWVQVSGKWPNGLLSITAKVEYEIPRECVETLGVDCSPLDRRDEYGKQGTVWFTEGQAKAMRGHRHARAVSQ